MERSRAWEVMDTDCLSNIFRRLDVDDRVLAIPFVCKSWYHASIDPLCWLLLDLRPLDFMPRSPFALRFTKEYSLQPFAFTFSGFLKLVVHRSQGLASHLMFPLVFGPSLDDLVFSSKKCSSLKTLVLPRLEQEAENQLPELIKHWKDLEELEMESKPSSFLELVAQISVHCDKFSGLKMFGHIRMEDSWALVNSLPKLKCLNLSKSCMSKEELMVMIEGLREMESLIVNECIGFQVDDEVKRRSLSIQNFEYEGCELRVDDAFDTHEFDCLHVFGLWG
ncbi:hypothetical protein J5N97_008701 [Dioscorea zingiberensis]|uniref:F-box domain-containing protein n=1 Tax=Dioscorea zingiberensis TaxID=325984 RepID=A0A9D5HL95_9LILI|nr:hypothetical protein J5N97_008701 [Dioscorea zingiberensis]